MATVDDSGMDRWMIGDGAAHSPESARRLLYVSTGGAEGVGAPNDMLVRPLAIPGGGVRVAIGSCLIRSKFVGGSIQTYQAAAFREQQLTIAPNTTNQDRYDLIVIRVEDSSAAGSTWEKPPVAERADEQYVYARVISGVSSTAKALGSTVTGYVLARVRIPASTGTITAGLITDLREVAMPKRTEMVYARPRIMADDDPRQSFLTTTIANGGEYFPGGNGIPNQFYVDVPEWATRAVFDAAWLSVSQTGTPHGEYWIEFGDEYRAAGWANKHDFEFTTQGFAFNAADTPDEKITDWRVMDEVPIPAKLRGKRITVVFKAGNSSVFAAQHKTWMRATGGLGCRITFAERALDADLI